MKEITFDFWALKYPVLSQVMPFKLFHKYKKTYILHLKLLRKLDLQLQRGWKFSFAVQEEEEHLRY